MRRTFIAVFIWALIQAVDQKPKEKAKRKPEATESRNPPKRIWQTLPWSLARQWREDEDDYASALDIRLIIHQNHIQRSGDPSVSRGTRVNLRWPSECGSSPLAALFFGHLCASFPVADCHLTCSFRFRFNDALIGLAVSACRPRDPRPRRQRFDY